MSDAGGGAAPGSNGADPWFATADDDTKGFFQNRGLDKRTAQEAAFQLAKDFRETQSKLGIPADRVVRWPADAADEANWKNVRAKLGVPETPEGYDFSAVKFADGTALDDGFAAWMRETSAKLAVPKETAQAIAAAFVKYGEDAEAADTNTRAIENAEARKRLSENWGPNAGANKFAADRAAALIGLSPEMLKLIDESPEYDKLMENLRVVDERLGEPANLIGRGSGGANPRVTTREGAIARMAELATDKAWYARFSAGGSAEVREWKNLNELQVGGAR